MLGEGVHASAGARGETFCRVGSFTFAGYHSQCECAASISRGKKAEDFEEAAERVL
jgi:hypothetical protein